MTALMTKVRNRPKTIMNSLRATIRPRVSDDEISARKTGAFPIRRRIHEERMFSRELAGYIVVEPCDTTDYEGFTAANRLLGAPGPRPTALFVGNALAALGALTLARSSRIAVPGERAVAPSTAPFLARSPAISLTSVALETERRGALAGGADDPQAPGVRRETRETGDAPPGSASGVPRCPEKSPSCPGTSGSC